jgi:dTDP-glucose 4,6-dehydratase
MHRSHQIPVTTARPFNTYGPRQTARAVIPTIVHQALQGSRIRLGTTRTTRDFTYVTDTADGLMSLAGADGVIGDVVNIGSGQEITIGAVVDLIGDILGKTLTVEETSERFRPDPSEVERLLCSNEKARRMLGWEPRVSLREGLEHTIQWIERHPLASPHHYEV